MTHEQDGKQIKSRIIAPPFLILAKLPPQARFSGNPWLAFQVGNRADADTLANESRVYDTTWNGYVPLKVSGPDDAIKYKTGVVAWEVIMGHFYDPYALITQAPVDEYDNVSLGFDSDRQHLVRTDGDCQFCVNSEWRFPEDCDYGKC